jgi:hypothetical protein
LRWVNGEERKEDIQEKDNLHSVVLGSICTYVLDSHWNKKCNITIIRHENFIFCKMGFQLQPILLFKFLITMQVEREHAVLVSKDNSRLVAIHTTVKLNVLINSFDQVWKLIGLSPQIAEELNTFVTSTNQKLLSLPPQESVQLIADRATEKR